LSKVPFQTNELSPSIKTSTPLFLALTSTSPFNEHG